MKFVSTSASEHKQVQPDYRFIMRCEELNTMNMRGYDS